LTPATAAQISENSPRHVSKQLNPPQQHRDLSSSIVSNLASARGIPSNRQRKPTQSPAIVSRQTAQGRVQGPSRLSRVTENDEASASTARTARSNVLLPLPPHFTKQGHNSSSSGPAALSSESASEEVFSRFYSTFEILVSKLSAPLAFAGLPLTVDDPTPEPEKALQASRASVDPDVTRIFSRAALRAVRDETGFGGPAESFYVVPTSGGTVSYAGMLAHQGRRGSSFGPIGEEEELFVDASETPQPGSPGLRRRGGPRSSGGKTMEELEIENAAYKASMIDLAERLQAFELSAQKSSMALHMSVRALQSPESMSMNALKTPAHEEKLRQLEDELQDAKKEMRRLSKENQRLSGIIERYRERWESLKTGARRKTDLIRQAEDVSGSRT
jgi:hypothetical protein